jgi:hypothetical protein
MQRQNVPRPTEIGRVAHKVDRLLVVHGNDDPALVTELVLVRVAANHGPGDAGVGAQERIRLLVRAQRGAD